MLPAPDTQPHAVPPGSRFIPNLAALAAGAVVLLFWLWVIEGRFANNPSQNALQSALAPVRALSLMFQRLGQAPLFEYWNVPLVGLLVFAAWLIAVAGIGRLLVKRLLPADSSASEAWFFSGTCGLLMVGVLPFILGLVWCTSTSMLLVLGLLTLSGGAALFSERRPTTTSPSGRRGLRVLLAGAALLLPLFLVTLTPPVQSDAMRYHLAAPQEYLKAGRIVYLPYNAFSNFPFLGEMHFLYALAANAAEVSQMMHFAEMLLGALGTAALAGRVARMSGLSTLGLWPLGAAVCYLAIPAGLVVSTWPNIDHLATVYLLAMVHAALLAGTNMSRGAFALLGFAAAGAAGTKYTMLPMMAPVAAVFFVMAWPRLRSQPTSRTPFITGCMISLALLVLLGGIWYLKSLIYTGNPVYPLAQGVFGGRGEWLPSSGEFYQQKTLEKGVARTPLNLLTSPWQATFTWLKYEAHNAGATLLIAWVLLLATLARGFRNFSSRLAGTAVAAVAFAYWIMWFYSYQSNRMLLPFVALAAAAGAPLLAEATPLLRRVAIGALAAAFAYSLLWSWQWTYVTTSLSPPPLPYLLGGVSRETYTARSLNWWQAFQYLNRSVNPGEKVLLIGEHRIYGADFEAVWSDWFDQPALQAWVNHHGTSSLSDFADTLRKENVGWVLINEPELKPQWPYFLRRHTPAALSLLEDLRQADQHGWRIRTLPPGIRLLQVPQPESSNL